jgi:hypothetical protein
MEHKVAMEAMKTTHEGVELEGSRSKRSLKSWVKDVEEERDAEEDAVRDEK